MTAALRQQAFIEVLRGIIYVALVIAFVLGLLSLCLRKNKALGATAVVLAGVATALGGAQTPLPTKLGEGTVLGLDWFLLNVLFWTGIFVPLERRFARREQPIFRPSWRTDLTYFFVTNVLVELIALATLRPASVLFSWAISPTLQRAVQYQSYFLQFVEILFLADLTQYWVHRTFHQVPLLWRFHAIHHSASEMDWLAGSRLHLLEIIVTRSLVFTPLYILGFSLPALVAYIAVVALQATFIHANVYWEFPLIREVLATPQFHHWHHAAEPEAVDKNFAVHLPFLDRLFGTFYLPKRQWPNQYGLTQGEKPVPRGYLLQLISPFRTTVTEEGP